MCDGKHGSISHRTNRAAKRCQEQVGNVVEVATVEIDEVDGCSISFLSGHGQLVVLNGAAAVDLVFDMATLTTCFRPVPDNVSVGLTLKGLFQGRESQNLICRLIS